MEAAPTLRENKLAHRHSLGSAGGLCRRSGCIGARLTGSDRESSRERRRRSERRALNRETLAHTMATQETGGSNLLHVRRDTQVCGRSFK